MLQELLWWLPALLVVWFGVMLTQQRSPSGRHGGRHGFIGIPRARVAAPGPLTLTPAKMEGDPDAAVLRTDRPPHEKVEDVHEAVHEAGAETGAETAAGEARTGNALPAKCCSSGKNSSGPVKTVRFALDLHSEIEDTQDPWGDEDSGGSAGEDEVDCFAFSYQVNRVLDEDEDDEDEDEDEEDLRVLHEGKTDFSEDYDNTRKTDFASKLRVTSCSPSVADLAARGTLGASAPTFSTFGKAPLPSPVPPPEGFRDRQSLGAPHSATPPLPPKHVTGPPMRRPPPPPPTLPPALPPKRPVPLPRGGSAASDVSLPPTMPAVPPLAFPPARPPAPPPALPPTLPPSTPPALPPKGEAREALKGILTPASNKERPSALRIPGLVAKGKENAQQLKLKDLIARFDACYSHAHVHPDRPLTKRASSTDSGIDVSPEPHPHQQDSVTLIALGSAPPSSDSGASSSDEGSTKCDSVLLAHSGPSSWEDQPPPAVPPSVAPPPVGSPAGNAVVERLVSFYQSSAPPPARPPAPPAILKLTPALGRLTAPGPEDSAASKVDTDAQDVLWKNEKNKKDLYNKTIETLSVRPRVPPPAPPPAPCSIVKKAKEKFESLDQGGRTAGAGPTGGVPYRRAVSDLSERDLHRMSANRYSADVEVYHTVRVHSFPGTAHAAGPGEGKGRGITWAYVMLLLHSSLLFVRTNSVREYCTRDRQIVSDV